MPTTRKLEILYYTGYFAKTLCEAEGFAPHLAGDLCTVTTARERLSEADVVVFHIPNVERLPLPKNSRQLWVGMSMESDANYPLQCDSHFMKHFDICMNFRSNADIRMVYFDPHHHLPILQRPPKPKHREAPAVYFSSNDFALNRRFELVAELMKHMQVDSYGKSQHNRTLDVKDEGRMTKLDTLSGYHFYFAFENSNSPDYVSEKMYDGLIAGTVPVYYGACNIDQFLPGDKCIIKVSNFDSPAQLASYLLALRQDKEEYASYLAWKHQPLRSDFLGLIQPGYTPSLRRLCAKALELKRWSEDEGESDSRSDLYRRTRTQTAAL